MFIKVSKLHGLVTICVAEKSHFMMKFCANAALKSLLERSCQVMLTFTGKEPTNTFRFTPLNSDSVLLTF